MCVLSSGRYACLLCYYDYTGCAGYIFIDLPLISIDYENRAKTAFSVLRGKNIIPYMNYNIY